MVVAGKNRLGSTTVVKVAVIVTVIVSEQVAAEVHPDEGSPVWAGKVFDVVDPGFETGNPFTQFQVAWILVGEAALYSNDVVTAPSVDVSSHEALAILLMKPSDTCAASEGR